jgi:hypothetical protein
MEYMINIYGEPHKWCFQDENSLHEHQSCSYLATLLRRLQSTGAEKLQRGMSCRMTYSLSHLFPTMCPPNWLRYRICYANAGIWYVTSGFLRAIHDMMAAIMTGCSARKYHRFVETIYIRSRMVGVTPIAMTGDNLINILQSTTIVCSLMYILFICTLLIP